MKNARANNLNEFLDDFAKRLCLVHVIRHKAAIRLDIHRLLSNWSLALLALAVIILELESQSSLQLRFSCEYVDIMQVVFAVMILGYSLLLGMGDYSSKSIKMYYCALSLGDLKRETHLLISSTNKKIKPDDVKSLVTKYNTILSRCENHRQIDYLISSTAKSCFLKNKIKHIEKYLLYFITFSHYIISVVFVYGWITLHSLG